VGRESAGWKPEAWGPAAAAPGAAGRLLATGEPAPRRRRRHGY